MREILFRGKSSSLRAGDWIYGYYNGPVGLDDSHEICDINDDACGLMIEVDPETVGQYTGLMDKNGKRIFEGDILKVYDGRVGVVVYDARNAGYGLKGHGDSCCLCVSEVWEREVIGNIHDNPELMEAANGKV